MSCYDEFKKTMLVPSRKIKDGSYIEFIGKTKEGNLIYGVMSKDGLFYYFHHRDVQELLDKHYPYRNIYGWYFNSSKDRYIAECNGESICVNPCFVDMMFVEKLYS